MPGIAIVGGGIAGLALAAALNRRGLAGTVFEAEPEPAETGAGVQIAPNASRLLHRLGLAGQLREVAVRPAYLEFRHWSDDRLIGRSMLGDECERLYGAPYYTIHRADLRNALASLVGTGQVCLGRRVVAVRPSPQQASLRFADGSSHSASIVVGADGIRSVVRAVIAADRPVLSGLGAYRGLVPAAAVPELAGEPAIRLWPGPGQHVVCYPVSAGREISFAAIAPCDPGAAESWTAEVSGDELHRTFGRWNDTVRQLIGGATAIRRWVLYDREPLPRMCTRRVALIGDAAHPMLPFAAQGANLAIEDALALAACLASQQGHRAVPGAVQSYQSARGPRTARLQRRARWNIHGLHAPDGAVQRDRDSALRSGTDLSSQAWLYGHDAESLAGQE